MNSRFLILSILLLIKPLFSGANNEPKPSISWSAKSLFEPKLFIENKGQFDGENTKIEGVLYSTELSGVKIYFTKKGITYNFQRLKPGAYEAMEKEEKEREEKNEKRLFKSKISELDEDEERKMAEFIEQENAGLTWLNVDTSKVEVIASDKSTQYFTYASNSKEEKNPITIEANGYEKILYKNVYANIDIEFYFHQTEGIKYNLLLHPGANPNNIKFLWNSKNGVSMQEDGSIAIKTSYGDIIDHAPLSFYTDSKTKIGSNYVIQGKNCVGLKLDNYDNSKEAIIDPWLVNPTLSGSNRALDISIDAAGNTYVYGGGAYNPIGSYKIAKINSAGTIMWIFTSPLTSWYGDIATDFAGNSYVCSAPTPGHIAKINTAGILTFSMTTAASALVPASFECFRLVFNATQTQFIGGTGTGSAKIANVNTVTGKLFGQSINLTSPSNEVRGLTFSPNGTIFGLTCANPNSNIFSASPAFAPIWNVNSGYTSTTFGYYAPVYTTYTNNFGSGIQPLPGGQNCIAASNCYVYTYDGNTLFKRSVSNGALVSSINVPNSTAGQNSGILVDDCENIYVGTLVGVSKFDYNLNLIATVPLGGAVYDLCINNNEIVASGNGHVTSIANLLTLTCPTPVSVISYTNSNACASCNGAASYSVSNLIPPVNYYWSNGSQTLTSTSTVNVISNLCSGPYTITAVGCNSVSNTNYVGISSVGAGSLTLNVTTGFGSCSASNNSATVTATGGSGGPYTYTWLPSGGSSSVATGLAPGIYAVSVSDGVCTSATTIPISILTTSISSNPSTFCNSNNGSATISVSGLSGPYSYTWLPSGGSNSVASGLSPGSYTVLVSDGTCTSSASANISVVTPPLMPTAIASPSTICVGASSTLTVNGITQGSAAWSLGTSPSTGTSVVVSPTVTTFYNVSGLDVNGCSVNAAVGVTINPYATINVNTGNYPICPAPPATISVSGSASSTLLPVGSIGTVFIVTPTLTPTTKYTVETISSMGCYKTFTVSIGVDPPMSLTASPSVICLGSGSTLTAIGAAFDADWYQPPGSSYIGWYHSLVVTPSVTTTYTADLWGWNCYITLPITVSVNPVPTLSVSPDVTLTCSSTTAVLSATSSLGGSSYAWTGPGIVSGANTASVTVNSAGIYTVTATNGCVVSKTVQVFSSSTLPNITASVSNSLNCVNTTATLTGNSTTSGVTYSWSPPNVTTSVTVVNSPGTYTLTITETLTGCQSTSVISVNQNTTAPNANAGTTQTITCAVLTATLNGSSAAPGATFSWNPTGITTATAAVSTAGNYTLTVMDPLNGCTNTSTTSVIINGTLPNISASVSGTLSCSNLSVTLTGNSSTAGVNYSWSPQGATTATAIATTAGNYTLNVTNPLNGCQSTSVITVNQNTTAPNANAGTTQTITCSALTVTLTGSSTTPGATFSWNPTGITTATAAVATAGNYTLTVTNPLNGCTNTSTTSVIINGTLPNISASTSGALSCTNLSVTLTGTSSTSGVSYSWSPQGVTTATAIATTAGNYTLNVTNPLNGCQSTSVISVNQNTTAPNANAGTTQTITCSALTVTLTGSSATPGATFSWNPTGITTATAAVSTAGNYTLTVTDPVNGCTNTSTTSVIINGTLPNISASASGTLSCTNLSVTLTGTSSTAGVSYSWSPQGVTTATAIATTSGNYTLNVTNPLNGCQSTSVLTVNQNTTAPNANAGTTQTITCSALTVTLTGSSATPGATFSWNPTGITTATAAVSTAGNYTLTVTNPLNGCTNTSTTSVIINGTLPNISASASGTLSCSNLSVTLTGTSSTAGVSYSWSPQGVTTATAIATTAGNYTLNVTNPLNGCQSTSVITVNQNTTAPNVNAGTTQTITCSALTVTLTGSSATPGATFSWNPTGITTAAAAVATAGNYTLTVTNPVNGCTNTSTTSVIINGTLPNISASASGTLSCSNLSVTLTGTSSTAGVSYSWSPQGVTTATAITTAAGNYTLNVTNPLNGCVSSSVVTVSQNTTAPNVNAGTTQTITCSALTVTLTGSSATPGATFSWNPTGITTATAAVSTAGNYTLTVTNPLNGCTNTSTTSVIINGTLPNISASASGTLSCSNLSVTLTGASSTSGVTYSWNPQGVTTATAIATTAGNYTLNVTNPLNGCQSTSVVTVNQNTTVPNANAGTTQTITCAVLTATLNGNSTTPGATFSWNPTGINTATAAVAIAGNYTLTVTDPLNGCTNTSTTSVIINGTLPNISASVSGTLSCSNLSVTLTGTTSTAGVNYSWSPQGVTTATAIATTAGNYTLNVTNPLNGCQSTSVVTVNQNTTVPNANAGTTQTITCSALTVTLTGSSATPGATFSWSPTGIITATAAVSAAGNYTLTVTDPLNGCTNTSTTSVIINGTLPNISASVSGTLSCTNLSVTLTGTSSTSGVTYSWNPQGVTTATAIATTAGNYTLNVTNPLNGCQSTSVVTVNQNTTVPILNITPTGTLTCNTTSLNLTAVSAGNTIVWNGPGLSNAANPTIINQAGTYTATATNPINNCTSTQSIAVTQNTTAPILNITPTGTLTCNTTSLNLTAVSSGNTIVWNGPGLSNAANPAIINQAGTYTATATNPINNCTSTQSIAVTQNTTAPILNITPTGTLTCNTTSLNLTAVSAGNSIVWNGPGLSNAANPTIINQAGTYTVTATNPINNCTSTQSIAVTQNTTAPILNITPTGTLTCNTTSLNLTAVSAGNTIVWNGPGLSNVANPAIINQAGTYTATATNPINGCSSSQTIAISQNTIQPSIMASVSGSLSCSSTSVSLSASSSNTTLTYFWQPGSVAMSSFTTQTAGIYSVTATDPQNGCMTYTTVVVNSSPIFTSNLNVLSQINCNSLNSGKIEVVITGGIGPFTITNINTTTTISSIGTPPVTFSNLTTGNYSVQVIDNTTGCVQLFYATITQPNSLNVSLSGNTVVCSGQNTTIHANISGGTAPYNYQWLPSGTTTQSLNVNAISTSSNNAINTITLSVMDNNGCSAKVFLPITIKPSPNTQFKTNELKGCTPVCASFSLLEAQDPSYTYNWLFSPHSNSNPTLSTQYNPERCFDEVGSYDVLVTVISTNGCMSSVKYVNAFQVNEKPVADFEYSPNPASMVDPLINFSNKSTNANHYVWNFGELGLANTNMSTLTNPSHLYGQAGVYLIALIAENSFGCADTAYRQLILDEDFEIYIPNTFTPNGDKLNDDWGAKGVGISESEFNLSVFDRWGEVVFEGRSINDKWDGTFNGIKVKPDVYIYKLTCKSINSSKLKTISGHVTVE